MLTQTSPAKSAVHKKTPVFIFSSPVRAITRTKTKISFFSRLNPVGWFNEFKNIKITLEEFDNKKNNMKSISRNSLILLALLFISAGLPTVVFCQSGKKKLIKSETSVYSGKKNYPAIISESDYPRATKSFTLLFPSASETSWIKEDNTLFAYFLNKGNKASATFSTRGTMNYSITLLDAASLPKNVKRKIKAMYTGYSIFCAKEIISDELTLYEVILENDTEFRVVQTASDEMIETNKVIK